MSVVCHQEVADLLAQLEAVAVRAEVVGSIRRGKPDPKDIEFLVEPKITNEPNLLGEDVPTVHLRDIRKLVGTWGEIVKGGTRYIKVRRSQGVPIDIFMVHPPAQWGLLKVIRTGPWEFSKKVVIAFQLKGYEVSGGHLRHPLHNNGMVVPQPTEKRVFDMLNWQYLPPNKRF